MRVPSILEVGIIIPRDGSILLLKRQNTGYMDGMYHLPAGHVESGETVAEAAVRELEEEVGLIAQLRDVRLVSCLQRMLDVPRLAFIFEVCSYTGSVTNREPGKCEKLVWFDVTRLPDNIVPYIKHALGNWQRRIILDSYAG